MSPMPPSAPGQGSSLQEEFAFESYTVSRENTQSPEIFEVDFKGGELNKSEKTGTAEDPFTIPLLGGGATGTSNTITNSSSAGKKQQAPPSGHPGIGSLPSASLNPVISSSPKRGHPGLGYEPPSSSMKSGFEQSGFEPSVSMSSSSSGVMSVGQLQMPGSRSSTSIHGLGLGSSSISHHSGLGGIGHPGFGSSVSGAASIPPKNYGSEVNTTDIGKAAPAGVVKVQTIGELQVPQIESDALSSPLGSVPSLRGAQPSSSSSATMDHGIGGMPGLGSVPGVPASMFSGRQQHPGLGSVTGMAVGTLSSLGCEPGNLNPALGSVPGQVNPSLESVSGQLNPSLGSVPGQLNPSLGSVPGQVNPALESVPGQFNPALGSVPGQMNPALGSVPGHINPNFGSVPGHMDISFGSGPGQMNPALGSVPGQMNPALGSVPEQMSLGSVPGQTRGSTPGLGSLGSDPRQGRLMMTRGADSGLTSGNLSFDQSKGGGLTSTDTGLGDRWTSDNAADGMSDDGSQFLGEFEPCDDDFLGGVLTKGDILEGNAVSSEIEMALNKLTPEEVERRRRMLGNGRTYR